MNKIIYILLLVIFTYGCNAIKKGLGLEKDLPDEFLIKKVDPIVSPPNFELTPPGSQIKKFQKDKYNTKKIIDRNLKKKSNTLNIEKKETNKVEQDILKNIKNND
tara:strand:+ start:1721 stop:2035 length:315 start_codon:yes stop_codon:yes gene_type:complete